MTCVLNDGQVVWSGTRDAKGYREYKIKWLVDHAITDGPANVMRTPGLPLPGAMWAFDDDVDPWAWCRPEMDVQLHEHKEGDPHRHSSVTQTFSNRPPELSEQRCHDQDIEDPLLEPAKISGSFVRAQEEATHDMFGQPILTSSHEMIRGPQNEWDVDRPTVRIEQNVATPLQAHLLPAQLTNCVNAFPMWGLPPRTIKLTAGPWERKFHGLCSLYYTRTLDFDIRYEGWDRAILDEGTKVLNGHWSGEYWDLDNVDTSVPPAYTNPAHFKRYQDRDGNLGRVVLNGRGIPAGARLRNTALDEQLGTGLDDLYICIRVHPRQGYIVGETLWNDRYWIKQVGGDTTWAYSTSYVKGNVVLHEGTLYVALRESIDLPPNQPVANQAWLGFYTGGTEYYDPQPLSDLRDLGAWSASTRYYVGDRVYNAGAFDTAGVGTIVVRKYPGADFLQLGIPLVF
jgi:hypothetical protein